ncbi:MAG: glutamate--tRNA ligase [Chloroflexi bacterium]|nr:glutamate--tRNA ligase [Chloroflexota bacterium]
MTSHAVRVRIAPSPTGDPHVGTAYMALFNLAFARQQGGQFILRVEDTDRARLVEGSEQEIYRSLRWLELEWDEGPDRGGPFGPYRQSERLPLYQTYARQLVELGHAYECWCTPERLEQVRAEQRRQSQPPRYDRFCLGKTRAQRATEPGFGERSVVRMLIPDSPPLVFDDLIRGETHAPFPDDQVILKSDGFPTYHLAVVVDDHEMRISHVTRGEEWISSTPKQLLLYLWLGWEPPKFAHFPLLRNPDRSKISKRKNPAARLLWFREQGYLPAALRNFLALMGWSMPDGREIFSFDDLVEHFAWERFSPVGPIFDVEKLDWLNHQYIQALPDEEFLRQARPFLLHDGEEEAIRRLIAPLKERTKRLADISEQVDFLYAEGSSADPSLLLKQGLEAGAAGEALRTATELVRTVDPFEPEPLEAAFNAEGERRGWKRRSFLMTVRVAATGKTATPPLFDTLAALGRERTIARLQAAAAHLDAAARAAR